MTGTVDHLLINDPNADQFAQWMQSTGFASIPACPSETSEFGTQQKIVPSLCQNQVSQGGASSISKKPCEEASAAPSDTVSIAS